jgi:hypothetical protein
MHMLRPACVHMQRCMWAATEQTSKAQAMSFPGLLLAAHGTPLVAPRGLASEALLKPCARGCLLAKSIYCLISALEVDPASQAFHGAAPAGPGRLTSPPGECCVWANASHALAPPFPSLAPHASAAPFHAPAPEATAKMARCSIALSDLRLNLLTLPLSCLQVRTRTARSDEVLPAVHRSRHDGANEDRS